MEDNDYGNDPSTFDQTMSDKDSTKWLEAMQFEMDSMHAKQVWTLVDPLKRIVPIRCK